MYISRATPKFLSLISPLLFCIIVMTPPPQSLSELPPQCINESRFLTVCRDFALRDLGMDLSTVILQPEFRKFLLDMWKRL